MPKCYGCGKTFEHYVDLANHINENNNKIHSNPKMRHWAFRYSSGIRVAPNKNAKFERQYDKHTPSNICPRCHKPYEGDNPNLICQC